MKKEELEKEEILENEEETLKETESMELAVQENGNSIVTGFGQVASSGTKLQVKTTVNNPKLLFNLDDHIDFKLNDMEGKEITVCDVVMKEYEKEKVNEETGEITTEKSIVTILIDENGASYVTASKLFAMRINQLVQFYANNLEEFKKGVKILITKTQHKNSANKKLGFELL